MIGLIGGTGIYDADIFEDVKTKSVKTPYGDVPEIFTGVLGGKSVAFLPRHGKGHGVPPHMVNYRANIYALKEIGVERIISINSVGGINTNLKPGDVVVPGDFLDFTKGRPTTFYDDEVVHIDVSEPYCPQVRSTLMKASDAVVERVFDGGVYVCTEGPRFETPAEIRMLASMGGDVVGMVGIPEAVLAREKEMCYASLCTVTNFAAGISKEKLTSTEVIDIVKANEDNIRAIIRQAIEVMPGERECGCGSALEGARM